MYLYKYTNKKLKGLWLLGEIVIFSDLGKNVVQNELKYFLTLKSKEITKISGVANFPAISLKKLHLVKDGKKKAKVE